MAPAEAETPADRGNNDKGACKKARKRIGVLALQGNFAQHVQLLEGLGMEPVLVRTAAQLLGQGEGREQLDGLVLPGGESTTMSRLLTGDLRATILDLVKGDRRLPVLGTCAGLILLADQLEQEEKCEGSKGDEVIPLRLLPVTVRRNAYGPQLYSSFESIRLLVPDTSEKYEKDMVGCFIRAPLITKVGPGVTVLAVTARDGRPCAVRAGNIVALSFHPELSGLGHFHALAFGGDGAGTDEK